MSLKMTSAKWRTSCFDLNVLNMFISPIPLCILVWLVLVWQVPIGHPLCGWNYEFCKRDGVLAPVMTATIASVISVVMAIVLSGVIMFMKLRYSRIAFYILRNILQWYCSDVISTATTFVNINILNIFANITTVLQEIHKISPIAQKEQN